MQHEHATAAPNTVELPRPTAWPLVLALGVSLIAPSMVTSVAFFYLGLVLSVAAIVGWFLQIFPAEAHEVVPVEVEEIEITTARRLVQRELRPISEAPRSILPIETFQMTTGIRG